ncbi:MAG: TauD/TfdA family dioxygenase [Rhodospirillales bacterium]
MQKELNDPASITAKRLTPYFAAKVSGVDLSQPLSAAAVAKIRELFLEHAVLAFRGQSMNNEAFLAFSRGFGRLDVHHLVEHTLPDHPEIRILSNVKKNGKFVGAYKSGFVWHTDQSYREKPALGSILLCDQCPPEGGNTEFACMTASYEALPEVTKRKLEGLIATFDINHSYSQRYPERPPLDADHLQKVPPVRHPLVRIHSETGRRMLYLSLTCISEIGGLAQEETRRLVEELAEHCTQPEFIYSHAWSVGDLVVWDNRCTMHRARPFDEKYQRYMRRTQIKDDGPFTLTRAA